MWTHSKTTECFDSVTAPQRNLVFGQNCQIPHSSSAHWTALQVHDMRRIRSHLPQPESHIKNPPKFIQSSQSFKVHRRKFMNEHGKFQPVEDVWPISPMNKKIPWIFEALRKALGFHTWCARHTKSSWCFRRKPWTSEKTIHGRGTGFFRWCDFRCCFRMRNFRWPFWFETAIKQISTINQVVCGDFVLWISFFFPGGNLRKTMIRI